MLFDLSLSKINEILYAQEQLLKDGKFSDNLPSQVISILKESENVPQNVGVYINDIVNKSKFYVLHQSIEKKKELLHSIFQALWKMEYLVFIRQYIKPQKSSNVDWKMKIKFLKGVGPKKEVYLNNLGIFNLWDLINYFPRDYEDLRQLTKIRDLFTEQKAMIFGEVKDFNMKKVKGYRIYEAVISDGTGTLVATWFNQDYIKTKIKKGVKAYFYGTVKRFRSYWTMNSPTFDFTQKALGIFPIYSLTDGITQNYLRFIIKNAYNLYFDFIPDVLPQHLIKERFVLPKNVSIKSIHFPENLVILDRAKKSLSYEEAFLFQLSTMKFKIMKETKKGIKKQFKGELVKKFLKYNNIKLTKSQKSVLSEIEDDMRSESPMNRLIQGDVGSGKTLIAELSIIDNYEAGYQSALMAPTVILAKQHYENIKKHLEFLGIKIELLYGGQTKKVKNSIKEKIKSGEIDLVVGTHALIQEDVEFSSLGLVIVDEQHKFGVAQRAALVSKNELADVMVMTATPIPRTLSMTLFGEIDISTITDMPFGKKDIRTVIINQSKRRDLYEFLKTQLSEKRKAFFVYPLVEESKFLNLKSAKKMFEELAEYFSDYKIALIHGKMSDEEKMEVSKAFRDGEIDVLVATTVIEVGIDVSDADIIVIEHAERFGLSQLHQLRGRVGRKGQKSYCFLIPTDKATQSLNFFKNTLDGFKIADYDLEVRGPGEFMGVRQHGFDQFTIVDIARDEKIIKTAQEDAYNLLKHDSKLSKYPLLKEEFENKYKRALFYAEIG
jgi:ATP-dependent DNA helicase RecG